MKKVLFAFVIVVFAGAVVASAQTAPLRTAPLSDKVEVNRLPSNYQYWSDHSSNKEFDITSPSGTADNAKGTVFTRGGNEFKILDVEARTQVYDAIKSTNFERVVYSAKKKEKHTTTTYKYDGQGIYVTVDYRPTTPPPVAHQQYAQAYIAEVEQGVVGKKDVAVTTTKKEPVYGWKFNKVH